MKVVLSRKGMDSAAGGIPSPILPDGTLLSFPIPDGASGQKFLLSKLGQPSRCLWSLPAFFAEDGISISWQGKNRPVLVGNHAELKSACRGQEFVVTAEKPELERKLCRWVESLTGRAAK